MPTPKITPDQASIVDATLERQEQYLKRLAKRLREIGVNHLAIIVGKSSHRFVHLGERRSDRMCQILATGFAD